MIYDLSCRYKATLICSRRLALYSRVLIGPLTSVHERTNDFVYSTRNVLDCDQSNYSSCIIFSYIFTPQPSCLNTLWTRTHIRYHSKISCSWRQRAIFFSILYVNENDNKERRHRNIMEELRDEVSFIRGVSASGETRLWQNTTSSASVTLWRAAEAADINHCRSGSDDDDGQAMSYSYIVTSSWQLTPVQQTSGVIIRRLLPMQQSLHVLYSLHQIRILQTSIIILIIQFSFSAV